MIQRLKGSEKVTPDRINRLIEDVERQTKIRLGRGLVGSSTSAGNAISVASWVKELLPAGADKEVQFNDGGEFGADSDFTWDKTNNSLRCGYDTDAVSYFGRAAIGWNSSGGAVDDACFFHLDHPGATSYALMQLETGDVRLNCPGGDDISFRTANVERMRLDVTDLRYAYNTDGVAYFGRAAMGYDGTNADEAVFAHLDEMNSTDYALRQESGGDTTLNSPNDTWVRATDDVYLRCGVGGTIHFEVGILQRMQLDLTCFQYRQDSNAVAYFGRSFIGYDSSTNDEAAVGHYDQRNNEVCFRSTTGGSHMVDVANGQSFTIRSRGPLTSLYFFNAAGMQLLNHKAKDLAIALNAWDDAYADDWHNVADFYHFDDRDDLAAICAIKPSGEIDHRSGHVLIDDDTLPEWLLTKDKEGKEVERDPDGKPYISMKSCVSLSWGAIRQLVGRLEKLEERVA